MIYAVCLAGGCFIGFVMGLCFAKWVRDRIRHEEAELLRTRETSWGGDL